MSPHTGVKNEPRGWQASLNEVLYLPLVSFEVLNIFYINIFSMEELSEKNLYLLG